MFLRFKKIQAAGNDYVYLSTFDKHVANKSELAKTLSDRHFGVGGDGVVFVEGSDVADGKMVMFNADGTEGNMCGNAIRAVAKILSESGRITGDLAVIETKSGVKEVRILSSNPFVATVNIGKASFAGGDLPTNFAGDCTEIPFSKNGRKRIFSAVSVGNPHAVTVVNSLDGQDVQKMKKAISESGFFTDDVNVEICEIMSESAVKVRVFERGTGETLACGTGATAAVAALKRRNLLFGKAVEVHMRGGKLLVENVGDDYFLTGSAADVFEGTTYAEVVYDK